MFKYTIPPIPTVFERRLYRSRLEARWGAFLKIMGIRAEYEPVDLGKWSPDFALSGCVDGIVYVEIKPFMEWDRSVARKIADAASDAHIEAPVLLLGNELRQLPGSRRLISPGWIAAPGIYMEWDWSPVVFVRDEQGRIDLMPLLDAIQDGSHGLMYGDLRGACRVDPTKAWVQAGNVVQWKAPA